MPVALATVTLCDVARFTASLHADAESVHVSEAQQPFSVVPSGQNDANQWEWASDSSDSVKTDGFFYWIAQFSEHVSHFGWVRMHVQAPYYQPGMDCFLVGEGVKFDAAGL